MKTIRKYDGGGLTIPAAVIESNPELLPALGGLAIPVGLAWAMYDTYKHPERTAYSRGIQQAKDKLLAAYAQMNNEEIAQVRKAAIAHNNALADHYAKELSQGPIVKNYSNGAETTITGYDPNTGRMTVSMTDPRGWTYAGTAPELTYNYLNGVNLEDELNGIVTTKYGTFNPAIDYVDWNTMMIKPGTLIEGLPGIAMAPPTGLTSGKINPRAMVLSTGQIVALPTDITDYRVFDEGTQTIDNDETENPGGVGEEVVARQHEEVKPPRRDDDDDNDDNQISSVEEYIRRFGKNMSRQTARRLRKSERVSHDANGNINNHATRLLNRGVNGGAQNTKTGGFNWKDFVWGVSTGAGLTLGGQAIFGNKEEAKDPELHGDVEYTERAGSAIDQVLEGDTPVSTQTDSLTNWENYFFPPEEKK